MPRDDLQTYGYRKQRARFLADKDSCHWCGTRDRKLTVDHLVPVAMMTPGEYLTPMSIENWVAACLPCNARRGARMGNALRRRPRRRAAIGSARMWE